MANSKSAEKRIRTSQRNWLQNRLYKSSVKTAFKTFTRDLIRYKSSKNLADYITVQKTLNKAYSLIDKGCKKNVFQKNTAARLKSKLALSLKFVKS